MFQVQTILPMPKLSNSAFQSDIKDGVLLTSSSLQKFHQRLSLSLFDQPVNVGRV
jgi:hypothetical protein